MVGLGRVGLADDAVDLVGRGLRRRGRRRGGRRGGLVARRAASTRWRCCSALKAASSDEQLKAEPAPASACWSGCEERQSRR